MESKDAAQASRADEIMSYRIASFDESFEHLSTGEKELFLSAVATKYHDLDAIIGRTLDRMYVEFSEGNNSKLYAARRLPKLHFKHLTRDKEKLRFRIVVEEEGKQSVYFRSAGSFFIIDDGYATEKYEVD